MIGKAIPTRRTAGLRQLKPQLDAKKSSNGTTLPESRQGTIKGVPKEVPAEEKVQKSKEGRPDPQPENPQNESPFEEPKLDVFGTGEGA